MELRRAAFELLACSDVGAKVAGARAFDALRQREHALDPESTLDAGGRTIPGRPARPRLVEPSRVPQRSAFTRDGRAALLHAVAHIEFNAINLALDAVWRFGLMPGVFYAEWAQVAAEEALHFALVQEHLRTLGFDYGDFDAHDGLWAMAERTRDDPLARMALVPRTLEARGLDVTPAMRAKFAAVGDARAAEILDVILRDEIGHVAIGNRWYRWLCARRGVDPSTTHQLLAREHRAPLPRPPFNVEARRAAGFDEAELAAWEAEAGPDPKRSDRSRAVEDTTPSPPSRGRRGPAPGPAD